MSATLQTNPGQRPSGPYSKKKLQNSSTPTDRKNWRSFNSRFLQSVNSQYTPPFTVKLKSVLDDYSKNGDLGSALVNAFQRHEDVSPPEESDLGTSGGRTQFIMFFENHLHEYLSGNTEIFRQRSPDYKRLDQELQKYLTLKQGVNWIDPQTIELRSPEDLAFMGLCGLIEKHLGYRGFEGIQWISPSGDTFQGGFNSVGIDSKVIENINSDGEFHSNILPQFLNFNSSLDLQEDRRNILEKALPQLLSRSSFIWSDALFGVDATAIEAMDEDERVLYLLENQSKSLMNAFNFLEGKLYPVGKALPKNFTNQANDLSLAMGKQKSLKDQHFYYMQEKAKYEKRFLAIQEEIGNDSLERPVEFLDMVTKMSDLEMSAGSQMQRIIYQTLDSYKRNVIQGALLEEQISDLDMEITKLKREFEKSTNEALNSIAVNPVNQQDLLAVYAFFSMIFSNDQIFPEVSLPEKAQGVKQKISKAFSKWKSFAKEKEQETTDPLNVFQGLIDNQAEKILAEYQPQSATYKYKELTSEDLAVIGNVAMTVSEELSDGKRDAVKKFYKLKAVIEKALLDDKAFSSSLQNYDKTSVKKMADLTAHIEASKVFVDQRMPKEFNVTIQSILDSATGANTRSRIKESGRRMLEAAKGISLSKNNQLKDFENNLEKVVNTESIQSSGSTLKIVRSDVGKNQVFALEGEYNKKAQALVQELIRNGWFSSYAYFEDLVRGAPIPSNPKVLKTGSSLYEDQTYSDGYRAFKLFWDSYIEPNHPEIAKKLLEGPAPGQGRAPIQEASQVLIQALELQTLQRKIQNAKQNQLRYSAVQHRELNDKTVDLLQDKTLFQFYQKKYLDTEKNQQLSNEAYSNFLPVFVASFTSVGESFGAEKLRKYKSQLLEDLPGSRQVFDAIEQWRTTNASGIQKLNDYLESQIQEAINGNAAIDTPVRQVALIENLLESAKKNMGQFFENIGSGVISGITSKEMLTSLTLSSGVFLGLAKFGLIPAGLMGTAASIGAAALFALSCGGLIYKAGGASITFVKKSLESLMEHMQGYLGMGEYSKESPLMMMMQMMEQALVNEMWSFGKFKEMQHKMNYALYIQEFFDTLDQMQTDFTTFRERTNALIPNVTSQANFSVLTCDVFCHAIKDVFLVVPPEILQRAHNEHFAGAIEAYLAGYKSALSNIAQGFPGRKVFPMDHETEFSRFLKAQTFHLEFASNSPIGKLFENQSRSFRVSGQNIMPYENINPTKMKKYVQEFLDKTNSLSVLKERFDQQLRMTLLEAKAAANYERPLSDDQFSQASNGLVSSLQMVRYGHDLSRALRAIEMGLSTDYSEYLKPTGETAQSVLSSKLMRESFSILKKTARFAQGVDLETGRQAMALLKELEFGTREFLKGGHFVVPPFELWEGLNQCFSDIIDKISEGYPSIAYPMLLELADNKGFLLPQILWLYQREGLGPDATEQIQEASSSKALYLTNQALNVMMMPNSQTRSFLLSPFLVDQFEKRVIMNYANPRLMKYLGRISNTANQMAAAQSRPMWNRFSNAVQSLNPFSRSQQVQQPQQSQYPMMQLSPQQGYHMGQQAGSMVNPQVGMAPQEYDPNNVGMSPNQALGYYGDQQLTPEATQALQAQQQPLQIAANPTGVTGSQALYDGGAPQQQTPQAQNQPENPPGFTPNMALPYMLMQQGQQAAMMGQEAPMSIPETNQPQQVPEIEIPQAENVQQNVNMVGVGADGGTFSYTAPDTPRLYADEAAGPPTPRNMPIVPSANEPQRSVDIPVAPIGSYNRPRMMPDSQPSFPDPAPEPYQNMSTANYNPEQSMAPAGGISWQQGAGMLAVGAGAAMGAALLAQTTRGKKKKK